MKSLDLESETESDISIAQSSSCSIYQDLQTRLNKVYGKDKEHADQRELANKKLMATKCPADELNEVVADLYTLDEKKKLVE
jgi:hypothetical protein